MGKVATEEREQIAEMLRAGDSVRTVAKAVGRGSATVGRIALKEGITSGGGTSQTKNALLAHEGRRAEVYGKLLSALHHVLGRLGAADISARECKDLAITVGILSTRSSWKRARRPAGRKRSGARPRR